MEAKRTGSMKATLALGALLTGLAGPTPGYAGNAFKSVAKGIGHAAQKAKMEKIAILPFVPTNGAPDDEGRNISERLITQVVRQDKVRVIERELLRKIMEEHYLATKGILSPESLKKMGKILSIDGIVTGSFVSLGGEVQFYTRMIHLETGGILYAEEAQVRKEWFDAFPVRRMADELQTGGWSVEPPPLLVQAPPLDTALDVPTVAMRREAVAQSGTDLDCTDAERRVNMLEESILDQKARYWALQMRDKNFSLSSLRFNPGSTIPDPALKSRFYALVKYWSSQKKVPPLSPEEVQRFVAKDGRAFTLHRECGL